MTNDQFNKKYSSYIEEGFENQGLMIVDEEVVDFLDKEFPSLIMYNSQPFKFSQIKLKFGYACIYCNANLKMIRFLENEINKILRR